MAEPWWNQGSNRPSSSSSSQDAWQKLAHGHTLGKKVNIASVAAGSPFGIIRSPSLNILQVGGPNEDALQLCITLAPPGIIPHVQFPGGVQPTDQGVINNATGDRTNDSFLSSPYKDLTQPIHDDLSWSQSIALVEWGIGGVQSKVECDFSNGLVLNVCASWVRVSVFTDSINSPDFITDGVLTVQAFIGPGYPKANNAQRSYAVGAINKSSNAGGFPATGYFGNPAAGHPMYPIPFMAKQGSLVGGIYATFDCNLVYTRDSEGFIPLAMGRFTPDIRQPLIVPNGAMYFTVTNNLDVVTGVSAIYDLAV